MLRFPTDCADRELLEPAAVRATQTDAISMATVRSGRGSTFDFEIALARGSDISRARAAMVAALPPGVSIVGGPSPLHGAQMGRE
jgi:hypothetical protein